MSLIIIENALFRLMNGMSIDEPELWPLVDELCFALMRRRPGTRFFREDPKGQSYTGGPMWYAINLPGTECARCQGATLKEWLAKQAKQLDTVIAAAPRWALTQIDFQRCKGCIFIKFQKPVCHLVEVSTGQTEIVDLLLSGKKPDRGKLIGMAPEIRWLVSSAEEWGPFAKSRVRRYLEEARLYTPRFLGFDGIT